jgi:tetratricopeptide (TPR) repeat protein
MKWLTFLFLTFLSCAWVDLALAEDALAPSELAAAKEPTEDERAEAKALFEQGVLLARARDFAAARGAFERAYQIAPHPIVMFNIARSAEALGDVGAAIEAYESYLSSSEDDTGAVERAERAEAALRIRVLRETLGPSPTPAPPSRVTVPLAVDCPVPGFVLSQGDRTLAQTPTKGTLSVERGVPVKLTRAGYKSDTKEVPLDGPVSAYLCHVQFDRAAAVPRGSLELRSATPATWFYVDGVAVRATVSLPLGPHLLEASAPGAARVSRWVQLGANERLTVNLTPMPLEEKEAGMRSVHWVAAGVGVLGLAALATSVGLFVDNERRYAEWQADVEAVNALPARDLGRNSRALAANQKLDQVQQLDAVTWAAAVTGGVLVGTGVILFSLSSNRGAARVGANGLHFYGRF